uniref:Uncharacterized protein n=1 Tax=Romanomermis culicivorax TaxID=13658 RepID=A0A915IV57_ROMCU
MRVVGIMGRGRDRPIKPNPEEDTRRPMRRMVQEKLSLILCILIPFELSLVFSSTNSRRFLADENRRSVHFFDHQDSNLEAFRRVARSADGEVIQRRAVDVNNANKNVGGFKITARFTREQDEDDPDDHVDVDDNDDDQMPTPDPSGGTWIGENYYGIVGLSKLIFELEFLILFKCIWYEELKPE